MRKTPMITCECEHESHFQHGDDKTGEHYWGKKFLKAETRKVTTSYGTYTVCEECGPECLDHLGVSSTKGRGDTPRADTGSSTERRAGTDELIAEAARRGAAAGSRARSYELHEWAPLSGEWAGESVTEMLGDLLDAASEASDDDYAWEAITNAYETAALAAYYGKED